MPNTKEAARAFFKRSHQEPFLFLSDAVAYADEQLATQKRQIASELNSLVNRYNYDGVIDTKTIRRFIAELER